MSNFQPVTLLDPRVWYKYTYLKTNSADTDQLASEANWSGPTLFAKAGYIRGSAGLSLTVNLIRTAYCAAFV